MTNFPFYKLKIFEPKSLHHFIDLDKLILNILLGFDVIFHIIVGKN